MFDPSPLAATICQLPLTLPTPEANLALDEALLVEADAHGGSPVLRTWESPVTAVVLGATCPWRTAVNVEACRLDGVPIVRRSSGGGTVVIGPGAWNFALILPIDLHPLLKAVDTAQVAVLDRCARYLSAAGVSVEVRGSGDLAIGNRKCCGSAQRRLKRTLLIHATILYAFPLEIIGRYLGKPRREPAYRDGRSHDDFVTNLPLSRDRITAAIPRRVAAS